ncbi:MAG TPA: NepR family anti-sigma factor [Beijerinckiaceae bacterium]|jgi:hypothetical protein|nr:NepR family anti-sigma factor [Beijerinckiaceae bacterium]
MDENTGRTKKTRVSADAAARAAQRGHLEAKPKRRAAGAGAEPRSEQIHEQIQVIEGGGRQRAPDVKDHVGRQLKAVYDDMLRQPVPSRFMDLLQELAAKSEPRDR